MLTITSFSDPLGGAGRLPFDTHRPAAPWGPGLLRGDGPRYELVSAGRAAERREPPSGSSSSDTHPRVHPGASADVAGALVRLLDHCEECGPCRQAVLDATERGLR